MPRPREAASASRAILTLRLSIRTTRRWRRRAYAIPSRVLTLIRPWPKTFEKDREGASVQLSNPAATSQTEPKSQEKSQ